jgi:hypothetical protein
MHFVPANVYASRIPSRDNLLATIDAMIERVETSERTMENGLGEISYHI